MRVNPKAKTMHAYKRGGCERCGWVGVGLTGLLQDSYRIRSQEKKKGSKESLERHKFYHPEAHILKRGLSNSWPVILGALPRYHNTHIMVTATVFATTLLSKPVPEHLVAEPVPQGGIVSHARARSAHSIFSSPYFSSLPRYSVGPQ